MYLKRLDELADNSRMISGIHNYCDRWCERCEFTDRCLNFALDREEKKEAEASETGVDDSEAATKVVEQGLQSTLELVRKMAAEAGVDLEELGVAEEHPPPDPREGAREHPCSVAAMEYTGIVDTWFETRTDLFRNKAVMVARQVVADFPGSDPESEVNALKENVDAIRWYQHFLYPKIMRALGSAEHERERGHDDEFPRDSAGSAKIALIAMDRSIDAWTHLRNALLDDTDSILDVLAHLERLRRTAESEFPNARAFVRPGFDEVP